MIHRQGYSGQGGRLILWNPLFLGEEPMDQAQRQERVDALAIASSERMKQISERLQKEVKKEMIKTAAAQTVISTTMAFIPIVGPVLSLAASVLFAVDARKYKKRIEEEAQKAEATISGEAKALDKELAERSEKILEEEIVNAHNEILAELEGPAKPMEGLGFARRIAKDIKRSVRSVAAEVKRTHEDLVETGERIHKEIQRVPDNAQQQFDVIRGKTGYAAVREKMQELIAENRRMLAEKREEMIALFATEGYRNDKRNEAKMMLLSDPDYINELQKLQGAFPQASTAVQANIAAGIPKNNIGTIALIGGAAFAAFMLMR